MTLTPIAPAAPPAPSILRSADLTPASEPPNPAAVEALSVNRAALQRQLGKAIVGQERVIDNVLLTIFCGGHALLVGVPGLAKTLLVRSLSHCLSLSFSRIQFTPDLMPSDITGTEILQQNEGSGKRQLEFLPGPVFANLVLADEINRTPPKTQAAMLQTMQEHEVTVGAKTYPLPEPFHVFATQNPIEMEGTYTLPEAQADRFMFSIYCHYPTHDEEMRVVRNTTGTATARLTAVLDASQIVETQKLVRALPVSDEVIRYAVRLVAHTRPEDDGAPDYVREYVRWGASPRASQWLVLGAKARAAVNGQLCADYDGVRSVAHEVLRHRLILNFHARTQKMTPENLIEQLVQETPTQ
jgi:MoxR-like ATPase